LEAASPAFPLSPAFFSLIVLKRVAFSASSGVCLRLTDSLGPAAVKPQTIPLNNSKRKPRHIFAAQVAIYQNENYGEKLKFTKLSAGRHEQRPESHFGSRPWRHFGSPPWLAPRRHRLFIDRNLYSNTPVA
jgi:hypothetical protein